MDPEGESLKNPGRGICVIGSLLAILLSGCAEMVGNIVGASYLQSQQERLPKFPEPSAGFQPKRIYNVDYDQMWKTALRILEKNKIIVVSAAEGRVVTDYIEGRTESMGPAGILGTITTRYKYSLVVERIEQTKTRLGIICRLESRSVTRASPGWHDISFENKQRLSMLEDWLYEQIENSL